MRDFLKSCGVRGEGQTKEQKKSVDTVLKEMSKECRHRLALSVGDEQGTEELMRNSTLMSATNSEVEEAKSEPCRKNVGEQVRLRRYNRGVFIACSGGGHIWSFDVLYKSEGPVQVC